MASSDGEEVKVGLDDRIPWVVKYRPRRVEEVVGQDEAKRVLREWLKQWAEGRVPERRAALLHGPPGVGKTSLVEALAREFDFDVLELNASDYRRKSDIERTVSVAARKKPLFKKGLLILMDEVDGIDPKADEGGIEALVEVVKVTGNPLVFTANDPWREQLRPLRELCLMVEFKGLSETAIVSLLQRICESERLQCDREALKLIAERSIGDARAAVNDLQAVAEGYGRVTLDIVRALIKGRDKSLDIWRTLNNIVYARQAWMAKKAVTQSEIDYETLITWLNDNIPKKYTEPEDLYRAYEALSRATLQLTRSKTTGEWSLLQYVFDLLGPGVTFARTSGTISKERYGFPEKIRLAMQLRTVREIREKLAEQLARNVLASKSIVKNEIIPYLTIIFRNTSNPVMAARIAIGYRFDKETVKFLAGPNADNIIKTIEKIRRAKPEEVKNEKIEERVEVKKQPKVKEEKTVKDAKSKSTGSLDKFLKRS
jgi:replication factor C large subunit